MPFRRGSSRVFSTWVSVGKRRAERSTGATSKRLARQIEALRDRLGERRTGDDTLLTAVLDGRLKLWDLYKADRGKQLDQLRERLDDVDLASLIGNWRTWLNFRARTNAKSRATYERQLRTFLAEDGTLRRSRLTHAGVEQWLAMVGKAGEDTAPATRRRYYAALQSFVTFLRRRHRAVLTADPLDGFEPPANARARCVWYPVPDLVRLIDRTAPRYRPLVALIQGTGADDGIGLETGVLELRRRDVDADTRIVQIRGTKRETRVRPVRVDAFAWPAFAAALDGLRPDERVFSGIRYGGLQSHWKRLRTLLDMPDYRLHDSRHSYGVRHMQLGEDPNLIGLALGHIDGSQVVRNYGRWRPTSIDVLRLNQRRLRALVYGDAEDCLPL